MARERNDLPEDKWAIETAKKFTADLREAMARPLRPPPRPETFTFIVSGKILPFARELFGPRRPR